MAKSSSKGSGKGSGRAPMTRSAAGRIQAAAAKTGGGRVAKGGFPGRAQAAAARNAK